MHLDLRSDFVNSAAQLARAARKRTTRGWSKVRSMFWVRICQVGSVAAPSPTRAPPHLEREARHEALLLDLDCKALARRYLGGASHRAISTSAAARRVSRRKWGPKCLPEDARSQDGPDGVVSLALVRLGLEEGQRHQRGERDGGKGRTRGRASRSSWDSRGTARFCGVIAFRQAQYSLFQRLLEVKVEHQGPAVE